MSEVLADTAPHHTHPHLGECRDCGLIQVIPALPPATQAACPRCDHVMRRTRLDPIGLPLALHLTGLMLFFLGTCMTMVSVNGGGQEASASILTGPIELRHFGLGLLALVVLVTTVAVPLIRVGCMVIVLIGVQHPTPPGWLRGVFVLAEHLRPWSMIEIYLLGFFVAYVKLGAMAQIAPGVALYALGALTVIMVAADVVTDHHAIWEALERTPGRSRSRTRSAGLLGGRLHRLACDTCGLVTRGRDGAHCPRCGFALHGRKPHSIARTWALLIAAMILYIPSNAYPVLIIVSLGSNQPSTILAGVWELVMGGMWPLALLVFVASVMIPILKLICMSILLITTQCRSAWRLRERTKLYRMVEFIGRWSMIDVFVVSILVALVQFGAIAAILPGIGALAFASVVILTMFAAECFDPRLMWDMAQDRQAPRP